MSNVRRIAFLLSLCICTTASGTVDTNPPQLECKSSDQCVDNYPKLQYCCGDCGESVCCNDVKMQFNSTDCEHLAENNEDGIGTSAKMLGAIIGGMVASFVAAMITQTAIHRCIKKIRQKRRLENMRNSATGEGNEITVNNTALQPPPIYEEVHLYRKLEKDSNGTKPAYNHVVASEAVFSILEVSLECDQAFAGNDSHPPPYNAIFREIESTAPPRSLGSLRTISETVSVAVDDNSSNDSESNGEIYDVEKEHPVNREDSN